MKHPTSSDLLLRALLIGFALAAPPLTGHGQTSGSLPGPALHPSKGDLHDLDLSDERPMRVTFSTPMVDVDSINRYGRPCPIVFVPTVECNWKWVSQTEGQLSVREFAGEVPSITHRARLKPKLRDLTGKPVGADSWSVEFTEPGFVLSALNFVNADKSKSEEPSDPVSPNAVPRTAAQRFGRSVDDPLPSRPRVRLEFSRDIAPVDLAQSVYFLDRDSNKRYAVEVNLEERQKLAPQGWFFVEPVNDLPAGHAYFVVLEKVKEARSGERLAPLIAIPAGTTYEPEIRDVQGYNQPGKGAFFRVAANQSFEPTAVNLPLISVSPPVNDFKVTATGNGFEATGSFDPKRTYHVTLKAGLLNRDGFPLAADIHRDIKFGAKRAAVIFAGAYQYERSTAAELRVPFIQVNTQKLTWKLARIPREKFAAVMEHLREFGYFKRGPKGQREEGPMLYDAKSGENLFRATTLLIPELKLPILGMGEIEASAGDAEIARTVTWKAPDNLPDLLLLEVSGKDMRGRTVGNRILISRTEWMAGTLDTTLERSVRLYDLGNGKPVTGVRVDFWTGKQFVTKTTDSNGEVILGKRWDLDAVLAGPAGRPCLQDVKLPRLPSGHGGEDAQNEDHSVSERGVIVTDRNVYFPGETVKIQGYVRAIRDGKLSITPGVEQPVDIEGPNGTLESFKPHLAATGTFSLAWKIPTDAYGDYTISGRDARATVKVTEFRPPPFSSTVEAETNTGDRAVARVTSMHYHGAPNQRAKVRWKAEWVADDWDPNSSYADEAPTADQDGGIEEENTSLAIYNKADIYSPDSPDRGFSPQVLDELKGAGWETAREEDEDEVSAVVEGEATTDKDGKAALSCECPFPAGSYGRFRVFWIVEITSGVTAQTVRGGTETKVQRVPQVLGAYLRETGTRRLSLNVVSIDANQVQGAGVEVKAELFEVAVRTAKEQLAPGFQRYVNTPVFTKVWEGDMVTPGGKDIQLDHGGNYIVRVRAPKQPEIPQISDAATAVSGQDKVQMAVGSDTALQVTADRPIYAVGDEMEITVRSPVLGPAIISVERDSVLDKRQVDIQGNISKFSVKALSSYTPNVWITVHLIAPNASGGPPGERFGSCAVQIDAPDHRLEVKAVVEQANLVPGAMARGVIQVRQNGKPVKGADVLIFAVDEAVLALGKWKLPDFHLAFFPPRSWGVTTRSALSPHWRPNPSGELRHVQKGFILGDGGGGLITRAIMRRDFEARAYWNDGAITDDQGQASFEFKTPEMLTSYRVVAVAQAGADKFGDTKATIRLSKPLQVEPILPAFLRYGDIVELRASVRQDYADLDELDVAVKAGEGIKLLEAPTKKVTALRGQPVVIAFRAQAVPGADRALIRFAAGSVRDRQTTDGEENRILLYPAVVERYGAVTGVFDRLKPVNVLETIPSDWTKAEGTCNILFSGSPYLPKLAGVSNLLEGAGSSEKLASRILTVTLLVKAAAYLPLAEQDKKAMGLKVADGLRQLAGAELRQGGLAAWPTGERDAEVRSDFATIEGAWAIRNAAQLYPDLVGVSTRKNAGNWLEGIINRQIGYDEASPSARCYALMAYCASLSGEDKSETDNLKTAMNELFKSRDQKQEDKPSLTQLSVEDRAWLVLAMHYLNVLSEPRKTLLRELQKPIDESEFDPAMFDSTKRAEAVRLLARSETQSLASSSTARQGLVPEFDKISKTSLDLSTQENLWLLLLFNSLMKGQAPAQIAKQLTPTPPTFSKNAVSAGWVDLPLARLAETFTRPIQSNASGSYLFIAKYKAVGDAGAAFDPDFQITRQARNITAPERTGNTAAPWRAGDQILLTYKIKTTAHHDNLEFEDQIPACLEVVNPDLPAIAENFRLTIEAGVNRLKLSHRELRFARTLLYFEKAPPGVSNYGVLAHVTVPGVFIWPPTQMKTMYDHRFYAATQSEVVEAR